MLTILLYCIGVLTSVPHMLTIYFSGFITGLDMVTKGSGGPIVVGIILLVVGFLFGLTAAADMVVLIKVLPH